MSRASLISLLRFLGLVVVSLPFASSRALNQPRALPPSIDPFYKPPAGFESKAPGTILRQRLVISAFFGLIPDPVETWQLLYRTTAVDGSPIATVTTIFKPLSPKQDRFISFHTAYDSSATACNPSYNYQLGALQNDLISAAEFLLLQAYLLSGYIVASPDYEGPDAAFAAGHLEGMGVLDGMRAVVNFKKTLNFSTATPMIVGVGYSGGAIATGWAASLHPTYAPELAMKGWVQGGTPANLTGVVVFIDNTLFSGFLPIAVNGLSKPSAYGAQMNPLLESIVTPHGQDILDFSNSHCAVPNILAFPEQSILATSVQSLGPSLLYQPDVAVVLQQNTMGTRKNETPTAPVFLYHAALDEIIPYANASALFDAWCGYGANVKFTTFANGGHITTEVIAVVDALQFVSDAFADKVPGGCSHNTELSSTLDPIALGVALEPLLVQLIEVLATAGKNDANIINDIRTLGKHRV
ncbi:Lipase, secreted [Metarhizium album ARSEF 1941]|uniref:Lipase, secreted n=1 Tax=Metarhizium album (strain ARSEF 1941) TaxID=1081103 RepID=A0A0B2X4Y5_METAS|nr:Lipase, secreted [Metarhizium album ARSEF 1941]KHO01434.1 Lipase, secreted [Metarhizium album ARSEF 1941]